MTQPLTKEQLRAELITQIERYANTDSEIIIDDLLAIFTAQLQARYAFHPSELPDSFLDMAAIAKLSVRQTRIVTQWHNKQLQAVREVVEAEWPERWDTPEHRTEISNRQIGYNDAKQPN